MLTITLQDHQSNLFPKFTAYYRPSEGQPDLLTGGLGTMKT